MADLQDQDPLVAKVAAARAASSRRPDEKFPTGRLNQIGNLVYAYSGDVTVSASNTTMLQFTTNSDAIKCKVEYHGTIAQIASNQLRIGINLNGISIIDTYFDATVDHTLWDQPPTLIIPPFTKFEMFLAQASGSNRTMQATLTGEVKRS